MLRDYNSTKGVAAGVGWFCGLLLGWFIGVVMTPSASTMYAAGFLLAAAVSLWAVLMWRLHSHRLRGPRIGRGLQRIGRGELLRREAGEDYGWREELRVTERIPPHILVTADTDLGRLEGRLGRTSGAVDGRAAYVSASSRSLFFPGDALEPGEVFYIIAYAPESFRIAAIKPDRDTSW